MPQPRLTVTGTNIDAPDANALADFYRRPAGPGDQQMMMHLEIKVDDLPAAVAHAVAQGATLAGFQPQDDVRVCLDPAGHPFCLFL